MVTRLPNADLVYMAHHVAIPMNQGKQERLLALAKVWRAVLVYSMRQWTGFLLTEGKLPRWLDAKRFGMGLSQRQWDSINRQARAVLDSWMRLRQDEFRLIINESTLTQGQRIALHRINRRMAWWEQGDGDMHKLARRIIRHLRHRVPFPDMSRCHTLSMDGKIADVQDSTSSSMHARWARVSTLTKGKPMYLPLGDNMRLERQLAQSGVRLANHLQLSVRDGRIDAHVMTVQPKATPREYGEVLGLDWGCKTMFATSDGRLLGVRLYRWLLERDEELARLGMELNRAHIPCRKSKRYRALNRRIRSYFTNEIGRLLNRLDHEQVKELVVEDLDLRALRLSRRMKRIISRAGRAAVARKLARLEQTAGITVTVVNPAYTSQTCNRCGNVDKRNRRTQETFHCTCCGHHTNADINASRNILARRSRKEGWRRIGRTQILSTLHKEHGQRCPSHAERNAAQSTAAPRPSQTDTEVKILNGIKYH